jgi:D-alanyl-D-alanine carboxypeptidase (penicillin-binding protein 5/6)
MNRVTIKITAGVVGVAMLTALLVFSNTSAGGNRQAIVSSAIENNSSSISSAVHSSAGSVVSFSDSSPASAQPVQAEPVSSAVVLTPGTDPAVKNPEALKEKICSPNAILIRADDGTILLDKNASQRIYPASMTKIMTALLAIEEAPDMDKKVTIQKSLIDKLVNQDASMAGFQGGEQVSIHDLLYGVILPSGAECCVSIAEQLEGTETNFVRSMNMRAEQLGLSGTHFVNTTGLHDPNHYSTVKDIAALLSFAVKNPTFRKVFTTMKYRTSPTNVSSNGVSFSSTMWRCLKSQQAGEAEILGGKVGFTDEAGLCLASMASYNGQEYILVTAGVKNVYRGHIQDAVTVYSSLGK